MIPDHTSVSTQIPGKSNWKGSPVQGQVTCEVKQAAGGGSPALCIP